MLSFSTSGRKISESYVSRKDIEFKLVHDLKYLLNSLDVEYDDDVLTSCIDLNIYAVAAKYPGFDVTKDMSDKAIINMNQVVGFCKSLLEKM